MINCVIFDMDGVLVASGPAHQASWCVLAKRHGLEAADAAFHDLFGRPSRDIIRAMWGDVPDHRVRDLDDEKEVIYRALITGMVPLMIGARETIEALAAAEFKLAIATSGPPENLNLVLEEARLERYFAATVHGFDVQRGKPSPDCYLLAAQRAGLLPAECVVIEDAPAGIQAGVAAGMPVIGLVGTHSAERLRAAGASRVVSRLAEITPALAAQVSRERGRA